MAPLIRVDFLDVKQNIFLVVVLVLFFHSRPPLAWTSSMFLLFPSDLLTISLSLQFRDATVHHPGALRGTFWPRATALWKRNFWRGGEFAEFPCMLRYSWPDPQLWPLNPAEICHERELLNTKWSLVQESAGEGESHAQREREREQESCTQRTHLSSLSFCLRRLQFCSFPPLLSLLFLFWLHKTVTPPPPPSLSVSLSHPHLVAFGHAIIGGHHHRYGFMATRAHGILGRNLWDDALMRARPSHPARNVCK